MTDHPPAIPAIQVRKTVTYVTPMGSGGAWLYSATAPIACSHTWTVPLGLSPEQPARLSGEPMP